MTGIVASDSTAFTIFVLAAGGSSMLSLLGCRLIVHLKEAGVNMAKGRNAIISPPTITTI